MALSLRFCPLPGLQGPGHSAPHDPQNRMLWPELGGGAGTHLHKHSPAQPCFHQGLGHPAGSVSRRAVHLGVVLPGEGPATVRPPAAVGVHDNLPASDSGIPLQEERGKRR